VLRRGGATGPAVCSEHGLSGYRRNERAFDHSVTAVVAGDLSEAGCGDRLSSEVE